MHLDQGWLEAHLWEEVLVVRSFPSSTYFNVVGVDSLVISSGLRKVSQSMVDEWQHFNIHCKALRKGKFICKNFGVQVGRWARTEGDTKNAYYLPGKPKSWDARHTDRPPPAPTLSAQNPVIIITKEREGEPRSRHSSLKFSQTALMWSKREEV